MSKLGPYTESGRWGDVARRHITRALRPRCTRVEEHIRVAVQAAKAAAHFARIAQGEHR